MLHAPNKDLLRFITCGSVDDGKSTLIGRLLFDTRQIFEDQLATVERDSRKHGTTGDDVDLALLVDGLEAEREQGITIDVAYRFFATPRRSFIVADTPGHEQYTRNMATGASTADVAVILVDARKGVLTQTKRHSLICSMLGIRSVVLAINKMDLVHFAGDVFYAIVSDYLGFARDLGFTTIRPIPLCARFGDNVTAPSAAMPWFDGPTLLDHLESVAAGADLLAKPFRFPVQWVNRPNPEFRGLAGTVVSGRVAVGDPVVAALSGATSSIARIVTADGDLPETVAGDAVTLTLTGEIDVARGDVLASPAARPDTVDQFAAQVLWLQDEPMLQGRSYFLQTGTATVPASITALKHKIDVNTLEHRGGRTLELNDVGLCNLSTARPIAFDPYAENRRMGAFILIDRATNATAGAGMIQFGLRRATNIHRQHHAVDKAARAALTGQKPGILWFTGLSGSGKSTIADQVEQALHASGVHTMLLDGDNLRHGLNRDLGFTDADRVENIRRVGEVAKLFVDAGLVVLCCFISPFEAERAIVRGLVAPGEFAEIFVDTPLDECIRRDPKGLYAKAQAGTLKNFTGIDSPYERPASPDLRIGDEESPRRRGRADRRMAGPAMIAYLLVALGGAIGSVGRAVMADVMLRLTGPRFPWGTILINILGSCLIGVFSALALPGGRFTITPETRVFVMVGVCGGFTTFSSFSLQTLDLLRAGRPGSALANIGLSVALCLVAVAVGYSVARAMSQGGMAAS